MLKLYKRFLCLLVAVAGVVLLQNSAKADYNDLLYDEQYQVESPRLTKFVQPNTRQSEFTHMFRTRIRNAGKNDYPNFAGHYIITTWGCGSSCQYGAIIDATNGHVLELPIAYYGHEYNLESRLLVVNPVGPYDPECSSMHDIDLKVEYWVISKNKLELIGTELPQCRN